MPLSRMRAVSLLRCSAAAIATLFLLTAGAHAQAPSSPSQPTIIDLRPGADASARQQRITHLVQKARSAGMVRVIVELNTTLRDEDEISAAQAASQAQSLQRMQDAVAARSAITSDRVRTFETIPYMSVFVTPAQLQRLLQDADVVSVQEDIPEGPPTVTRTPPDADAPSLNESVPLIGAKKVWGQGYTGEGWVVAVLDTGADHTHPMLRGKLVAGLCRSSNIGDAKSLCPGGRQASNGLRSGRPCPSNVSGCSHGTHVASIAVGNTRGRKGVAPGAKLISAQVFSRFPPNQCDGVNPCARAYVTDQVLALERIFRLRKTFNIAAVNMSLGGGAYSSHCDSLQTARAAIINKLFRAKIATVISSGNDSYNGLIGAPACIKNAVAVGSTTKADAVSYFSNHADIVDLMAPGSSINAAIPGGAYAFFSGTSMAAPHVAGVWALLRQAKPGARVNQLIVALRSSGIKVTRGGIMKKRVHVRRALNKL